MILAQSPHARSAYALVLELQAFLRDQLDALGSSSHAERFQTASWLRNEGRFGGGQRSVAQDPALFNRASINISQVQYESDPSKALASATALSTIIHPQNPHAPSMHMHISWTEMKSGGGYWRIMADLNPSLIYEEDRLAFEAMLKDIAGEHYTYGREQGERYFFIPGLKRHRGVAHFYLENFKTGDFSADLSFARAFGRAVSRTYAGLVKARLDQHPSWTEADRSKQLQYHSLYFLQVLTLDRGTTSGLLVHSENDVGILGSIPAEIDRAQLEAWRPLLPDLQSQLLGELLSVFPGQGIVRVGDDEKKAIASRARQFYQSHPEAQELLARGDLIPPTQSNHQSQS